MIFEIHEQHPRALKNHDTLVRKYGLLSVGGGGGRAGGGDAWGEYSGGDMGVGRKAAAGGWGDGGEGGVGRGKRIETQIPGKRTETEILYERIETKILYVVPTALTSWKRRELLRRQFARSGFAPRDILLLFVVGIYRDAALHSLPAQDLQRLEEEEATFGDLLVTSCPDNDVGYSEASNMHYFWSELPTSSTTCKTMEIFKFAHHHVDYHYLMRMGDDAYMNPHVALNLNLPRRRLYFGRMNWPQNHRPISNAQQLFGLRDYPEYAIGIGIVFSPDVVSTLAMLGLFWLCIRSLLAMY